MKTTITLHNRLFRSQIIHSYSSYSHSSTLFDTLRWAIATLPGSLAANSSRILSTMTYGVMRLNAARNSQKRVIYLYNGDNRCDRIASSAPTKLPI